MKIPFIDLKKQYHSIKPEIDEAIFRVLDGGNFIGGEPVQEFAIEFAKRHCVEHCIPVANGTDALFISIKMLGIGAGDEVILASNVWVSCATTIMQCGATPVFADIESNYFTISTEEIKKRITKKTKAIMPVHLYGQSCDMDAIMELAKANNLLVIEDCSQAHFSRYKDQLVGTFGDVATYSFYPTKNLGAYGDGGCILTNDEELALKCKAFANYGSNRKNEYLFQGINSRLDTIQAAILNVKLKYIEQWNNLRALNAKYYLDNLKDVDVLILPTIRPETKHTFYQFVVLCKNRNDFKNYLSAQGVETMVHYPYILPRQSLFNKMNLSLEDYPLAINNELQSLSLPININKDQQEFLCSLIHKYVG